MGHTLAYLRAACILVLIASAAPAIAQFPPGPDDAQEGAAAAPRTRRAALAAGGPNILGDWIGQVTQIGSEIPYKLELMITARGAETRYPDLDCTGKLTRVGSSKSYVFFVEVITKGQHDKGGRCPDGTITVARQGDGVAVAWFGAYETNTILAYGTLKKK